MSFVNLASAGRISALKGAHYSFPRAKRLREYEAQRAAQAANLAEEQREAEATRGAEQTPDPAANAAQAGAWEPGGGEAVEETIYLLRFECQVTRDQAAELSRWLKERNISYRRI